MSKTYRLRFPRDAKCMVGGCDYPAEYQLNLRIRRKDTGAIYGPNIDNAYLCEKHGKRGLDIEMTITPRNDGLVVTTIDVGGRRVSRMTRPITGGDSGQGGLF